MKILYINASSQLGGAERNLIDVICAVLSQDPTIEITVLITAPDGPLVAELTPLGVKIVILELPRKIAQLGDSGWKNDNKITNTFKLVANISLVVDFARYWWQLRQMLAQIDPEIIHSNGFKTHLLVASLGTSVPIIWHLHDFISSRLGIGKLLKFLIGRVTVAIAISEAVARDWQTLFPHLQIELIYNAIDTDKYRPIASDLGIIKDSEHLKIGLVATYALWKGHDIFIQAIGQIARQHPELKSTVKFYIIGGAIYETEKSQYSRSTLQQLARDLNVEDWLSFIDFQSDIVSSYNMLDIIVHASTKPEPFGRTIVEAMACEKAVIVSKGGGAAELFTHQQDAIGFTPGDPVMLATAIGDLINEPAKRVAMGKAGRINAIERFALDRLATDLISLYRNIVRSQLR
jgi:glycosyltransferase involved in cell wall biosynthesis